MAPLLLEHPLRPLRRKFFGERKFPTNLRACILRSPVVSRFAHFAAAFLFMPHTKCAGAKFYAPPARAVPPTVFFQIGPQLSSAPGSACTISDPCSSQGKSRLPPAKGATCRAVESLGGPGTAWLSHFNVRCPTRPAVRSLGCQPPCHQGPSAGLARGIRFGAVLVTQADQSRQARVLRGPSELV